jgi:hypothetical protein
VSRHYPHLLDSSGPVGAAGVDVEIQIPPEDCVDAIDIVMSRQSRLNHCQYIHRTTTADERSDRRTTIAISNVPTRVVTATGQCFGHSGNPRPQRIRPILLNGSASDRERRRPPGLLGSCRRGPPRRRTRRPLDGAGSGHRGPGSPTDHAVRAVWHGQDLYRPLSGTPAPPSDPGRRDGPRRLLAPLFDLRVPPNDLHDPARPVWPFGHS